LPVLRHTRRNWALSGPAPFAAAAASALTGPDTRISSSPTSTRPTNIRSHARRNSGLPLANPARIVSPSFRTFAAVIRADTAWWGCASSSVTCSTARRLRASAARSSSPSATSSGSSAPAAANRISRAFAPSASVASFRARASASRRAPAWSASRDMNAARIASSRSGRSTCSATAWVTAVSSGPIGRLRPAQTDLPRNAQPAQVV
jgi:hypothetical protein